MAKKVITQEIDIEDLEAPEFVAIVKGLAMIRKPDGKIDTIEYREAFIMEDISAPLSHIKSFYLLPRLMQKHGRTVTGIYTHILETVFPKKDPKSIDGLSIQFMSFEQLETYCRVKAIPGFKAEFFPDILAARETVSAYINESPEIYHGLLSFNKNRVKHAKATAKVLEQNTDDILAAYDEQKKKGNNSNNTKGFEVI